MDAGISIISGRGRTTINCMLSHSRFNIIYLQAEAPLYGIDWNAPFSEDDDAQCVEVPHTLNPLTPSDFMELCQDHCLTLTSLLVTMESMSTVQLYSLYGQRLLTTNYIPFNYVIIVSTCKSIKLTNFLQLFF